MKIGLIDADLLGNGTKHPNLALMKLSGYYKSAGNEVHLIQNYNDDMDSFDKLFMSKVFNFTVVPDQVLLRENLEKGGTGFFEDSGECLPYEIEHHMPDYSLYDDYIRLQVSKGKNIKSFYAYTDYSIGFITRGCFRKCDFCVNKKYDRAVRHAYIEEFLDKSRKKIYLWDDNILAFEGWKEVLFELENIKKPFQFRQGLDLRLMTPEKAKILSELKYSGDYIFAFDNLDDKDQIISKLKIWREHCKKTTKLYVLTAYYSQDEKDIIDTFERIKIVMEYGCLPYIMRYEKYKESKHRSLYIQLARWCNQPQFFKKMSFRQFCEANQKYHKTEGTFCSAYRALVDFESQYPGIAKEYFDLRYEEIK